MIGRGPRADLSVRNSSLQVPASTDDADDTVGNGTTVKSSGALKQVFGRLLPNHEMVCDASRGQMRLFVFVRAPLAGGCSFGSVSFSTHVTCHSTGTEKRIAYENTGLGHVVANKGGIAFVSRSLNNLEVLVYRRCGSPAPLMRHWHSLRPISLRTKAIRSSYAAIRTCAWPLVPSHMCAGQRNSPRLSLGLRIALVGHSPRTHR